MQMIAPVPRAASPRAAPLQSDLQALCARPTFPRGRPCVFPELPQLVDAPEVLDRRMLVVMMVLGQRHGALEAADDRAVRPVVAFAALRQVAQGVAHLLEPRDLLLELLDVGERERLDVRARPLPVAPELEEV